MPWFKLMSELILQEYNTSVLKTNIYLALTAHVSPPISAYNNEQNIQTSCISKISGCTFRIYNKLS